MAQVWKDAEISLDPIKDQTVAVIGYGIQGDAQANNMKDSGLKVVVGLKEGGSSWKKAASDGHRVLTVAEACKEADIIHVLVPDMIQAQLYRDEMGPNISKGKALSFSHAAAIHWKWIEAPSDVDVIMVAPKGPGSKVRETYLEGFGTPSIVAVEQDSTGGAWDRTLGLGKAIGSARAGLIKTTFKEEVETDWFGEQADLCGGSATMVVSAFETLVEAGYQPEIAYFEVLHELKLIVDMIQKYGINGMWRRVSETARYGGLTRGPMVMDSHTKERMGKVLKEIQDGTFNEEWVSSYRKDGRDAFDKYMKELDSHQIEQVGRKMRKMMWPDSTE
ncbi:ketol-acid reductoisomerase [Cenarchaeum symbiosum A]|uniref:Ketol-acid reductoisomerase (NADP(+)) n=1 Tax=Cenarchaeum symbiosum (strain A) TaxID=414004 RepID=ILVC_CENSY|nr:RecName: Full=Ketol-acid reductoisomerase (NADP(+)); Short=KARI; AltName: Full=Acetohydroxy-acid isomeroreductase; Short=AHIR; AltName: Full=Alpha-keto-beta-hydroxylacyl reductoisomerase; AltName: Full=Ketol-acid reductoisomerase type 1; AltName: Full=Ketol-acid reductoisomerase type I [Cenarchaeum symbiosum A]ABK78008.1 ketol-acid reductoisomerase [Cenarchaeum symbiosum A]